MNLKKKKTNPTLSKSKHMPSSTVDITKGTVRSLKQLMFKELRKTPSASETQAGVPLLLSHLRALRTLPFFQRGDCLDRLNLSPSLYPESQTHPKARKYSKTEEIFTAAAATSAAMI